MSKHIPAAAERWAVSTRTSGAVLTAGVSLPGVDLCLLGIPTGFTAPEIQSWLKDLAGVAIETSRTDDRTRPIPQLMHHALTGLLFSQTELWSHTGQALPCAAVFVQSGKDAAFGWVGRARVVMLLNGEPFEPQWVLVRDEAGNEAMSAKLPADSHALISIDYWPEGEDGRLAPASVEAEYGNYPEDQSGRVAASAPSAAPVTPAVPVSAAPKSAPPAPRATAANTPAPSAPVSEPGVSPSASKPPLPTQQPGLAPDPSGIRQLDPPGAKPTLPSTRHPSSATFAMPVLPGSEGSPAGTPAPEDATLEITPNVSPEAGPIAPPSEPRPARPPAIWKPSQSSLPSWGGKEDEEDPGHPVGRWLSKLMGLGRKAMGQPDEPAAAPPVSAYDRVLSQPGASPPPSEQRPSPPPAAPAASEHARRPGDIGEPSPLPETAAGAIPETPRDVSFGRFKAAGLGDILGTEKPATPIKPVEGLTAVSAASGPSPPGTSSRVTPPATPGDSLYPTIDLGAPPKSAMPPGPIQIEREPIGADASFGIPKLPPRDAPKQVRVPPVQPPVLKRPEEAGAAPSPAAPTGPQPPVLATPGGRAPVAPPVPEPPADFLAEFARSGIGEAATQPAPSAPGVEPLPPDEPPRAAAPPPLSSKRRVAPSAPAAAAPAPAPVAPPAPVESAPSAPVMQPIEPGVVSVRATPRASDAPAPVLKAPTRAEPVVVSASEVPALMRELKLPTPSAEMERPVLIGPDDDDAPEGMLVARPATPMPDSVRARRSAWPGPEELEERGTPFWRKPWFIGTFITVLFGIGWLVGHSQAPDNDVHATPMTRLLRVVGLGGARFTALVDSDPPGAWISVDGRELSRQTPSTLELVPGAHRITLAMPDLGSVDVDVKGSQGQQLKVNEALHGSLDVRSSDPSLPVKVSLDGAPQGWLPVHLEHLPPGMHEVQFTGPNMQPWAQTVNVTIRGSTSVVAKPMTSPATGQLQVAASINDDNGTAPLSGASVYVDGEPRGVTPLSLELPRGPHSLRVSYSGETAPVQVIDLPGGNRRFASFQFGLNSDLPPLRLQGSFGTIATRRPTTVAASLEGLDPKDLREAWLHVRNGDGLWRRYEMTIQSGATGAVMSVVFPTTAFDASGRVTWYLSAATAQGDEFFTEMQRSSR